MQNNTLKNKNGLEIWWIATFHKIWSKLLATFQENAFYGRALMGNGRQFHGNHCCGDTVKQR